MGIAVKTLSRYIAAGKVPSPKFLKAGKLKVHVWTEEEVEGLRTLLPKIANGRKTRYQRLRGKQKTPARAPVPHKPKKKK